MQGLRVSPTPQMARLCSIVYADALRVLLSADLSHNIGIIVVVGAMLIEVERIRKSSNGRGVHQNFCSACTELLKDQLHQQECSPSMYVLGVAV